LRTDTKKIVDEVWYKIVVLACIYGKEETKEVILSNDTWSPEEKKELIERFERMSIK